MVKYVNLSFHSAAVIKRDNGPDVVFLYTDLPNPEWPYNGNLMVRFNTAKGTGEKYVKDNFKIQPKLV